MTPWFAPFGLAPFAPVGLASFGLALSGPAFFGFAPFGRAPFAPFLPSPVSRLPSPVYLSRTGTFVACPGIGPCCGAPNCSVRSLPACGVNSTS